MSKEAHPLEERVLLLARTERDAAVSAKVLREAGLPCFITRELAELTAELGGGAGVILLPEEVMSAPEVTPLIEQLAAQPPWSDLPVIVLSRQGTASPHVSRALAQLPNVMLLELPVRVDSLVSAVQTALRARRRQYQLRQQLDQQRQAQEALREADRRKDDFLAMLAHELRNPLAPVRNGLHLLRLQAGDPAATDRLREMMERQVQHMIRLIDDLLDVSRISRGKVSLQRERLDLGRLVQVTAEDHRARFDAAGVRLEIRRPDTPVWLLGDPTRLSQVVDNLLENARKFTDQGGSVTVELSLEGAAGAALLTVRDTGIGLEAEMLPRLFDVFSQADRSLDRSRGGLGVGLAVVKGLIELHGGTVSAHSAGVGQGTAFTLRLQPEPEPPALSSVPVWAAPDRQGLRVLIVEDNPDAADSLQMLLEAYGWQVGVVYTGPAGLEAARATKPDVVLCDIGLPEMDGYAVAQALRRDPEVAGTRLIALTGYGQEEDVRRARDAGFDQHMTKPVDPEKLLATLEERATAA